MKLLYFAHLRAKIGTAEETLDPPPGVRDVTALIEWLKGRGPKFADALGNPKALRVAVNQTYVGWQHPVKPGDEVAIFPPVTGG
ncbi:MAG TPA: molybdopterin converting factor subunit 1 [Stellaceae bacterium]|jgi:molybdopterin synthase sulfur carrier subunit|nr:molybdopterin converting factor subunit 1 [Stellaceae bacterium]